MFGLTTFAQSPFAALGGNTYLKDLTETAAISDSVSGVTTIPVSISETDTITATVYSTQALAAAISESATAGSSLAATLIALASINESVTITDQYSQLTGKFVYITETSAINDAVNTVNNTFNVSRTELVTPEDTVSTGAIISANVTENGVHATDSVTVHQTMRGLVNESVTVSDVYSAVSRLVAAINESAAATATQAGSNYMAVVNVTETVTATATQVGGSIVSVAITETSTATAAQTAHISAIAQILESAAIADTITYTVDTKGIVTGILLTISLSSPLVWNQIDNDQNPNWVEIKD